MLLYGELSILQDFNMVKRKSRPQTIKTHLHQDARVHNMTR